MVIRFAHAELIVLCGKVAVKATRETLEQIYRCVDSVSFYEAESNGDIYIDTDITVSCLDEYHKKTLYFMTARNYDHLIFLKVDKATTDMEKIKDEFKKIQIQREEAAREANKRYQNTPQVKKVIYNDPATIVFWTDGTKTVVKCGERDTYDTEKGLAMCFVKKWFGNKGNYYNKFYKWLPKEET